MSEKDALAIAASVHNGASARDIIETTLARVDRLNPHLNAFTAILHDRDGIASLVGSTIYHGGWEDKRAGHVQPLSQTKQRKHPQATGKRRAHRGDGFGVDRGWLDPDDGRWDDASEAFAWCGGAVLLLALLVLVRI